MNPFLTEEERSALGILTPGVPNEDGGGEYAPLLPPPEGDAPAGEATPPSLASVLPALPPPPSYWDACHHPDGQQRPALVEMEENRTGCYCFPVPVFTDLLFERTMSRRLSLFLILQLLFRVFFLVSLWRLILLDAAVSDAVPSSDNDGGPPAVAILFCKSHAAPITAGAVWTKIMLLIAFLFAAGGASLRWNRSARLVAVALLLGVGYLIVFFITELKPCADWITRGTKLGEDGVPGGALLGTVLTLYNGALLVGIVYELAVLAYLNRDHIQFGLPLGVAAHKSDRDPRSVLPPSAAEGDPFSRTFEHWRNVLFVTPLRYTTTVFSTVLLFLAITIVCFVVGVLVKRTLDKKLNGYDKQIGDWLALVQPAGRRGALWNARLATGGGLVTFSVGEATAAHALHSCLASSPPPPSVAGVRSLHATDFPAPYSPDQPVYPSAPAPFPAPFAPDYPPAPDAPASPDDDPGDGGDEGPSLWSLLFQLLTDDPGDFADALNGWQADGVAVLQTARDALAACKTVLDSLLDVLGPAALAAFLLTSFCLKRSFDFLWEDHLKIAARWPLPQPAEASQSYVPESMLEEHLLSPAPADDTLVPPATVLLSSIPAAAVPPTEPTFFSRSGRLEDGTLDVVGNFQLLSACQFVGLLFVNAVFSYSCLFALFYTLFLLIRLPWTRVWILTALLASPIASFIGKQIRFFCLSYFLANGNRVVSPRLLLWWDTLNTFGPGAVLAVGAAFQRFLLGTVHLFCKLLIFQVPILPERLALFDAGFGIYGSLMKARYASIFLDDARLSDAPQVPNMLQPGGFVLGGAIV